MGNKNAKKVNQGMESEQNRIYGAGNRFNDLAYGQLPGSIDRSNQIWNTAFQGYGDLINRGASGGFSSGGGGGFTGTNFRGPGYGAIEKAFMDFANSGGVDDEGKARMRGNGVFDEYAKTGGLSEEDRRNFRSRATSTIPSFYENLRENLNRNKTVQGGYSPGYDAQMAKLARDQAQGAEEASLNAETGLTGLINQGRQWGAGSLSSAEQALQSLISSNKLGGWGGALGARKAGADDDYRSASLASDNAYKGASLAESAAGRNQGYNLQAMLGGLEGLRGLRTDQPGESFGWADRILQNNDITGRQAGGMLGQRAAYNPNTGVWDKVMDIAGLGASVAPMFFGMPPGIGGGIRKGPSLGSYGSLPNAGAAWSNQVPNSWTQRYNPWG